MDKIDYGLTKLNPKNFSLITNGFFLGIGIFLGYKSSTSLYYLYFRIRYLQKKNMNFEILNKNSLLKENHFKVEPQIIPCKRIKNFKQLFD